MKLCLFIFINHFQLIITLCSLLITHRLKKVNVIVKSQSYFIIFAY